MITRDDAEIRDEATDDLPRWEPHIEGSLQYGEPTDPRILNVYFAQRGRLAGHWKRIPWNAPANLLRARGHYTITTYPLDELNSPTPHQSHKIMKFTAQYTDTFAGEPNYAWVRTSTFEAPDNASTPLLVRRAKMALNVTGPHRTEQCGETITIRPRGECAIIFVTVGESESE